MSKWSYGSAHAAGAAQVADEASLCGLVGGDQPCALLGRLLDGRWTASSRVTAVAAWLSKWSPTLVVVVGALLLAPTYFDGAYCPDEVWFDEIAANASQRLAQVGLWSHISTQENELGYGAVYWILYSLVEKLFRDPRIVMRLLAMLSVLAAPWCTAYYAKQTGARYGWFAVLLWATFPLFWWTGKSTGPDTFCLMLSTLGVTTLLLAESRIGLLAGAALLGGAVGIKLTAAPVVVFAAVALWYRIQPRRRGIRALAAGLPLGFILANPVLLFYPKHFLANCKIAAAIAPNGDLPRPSWQYVAYLFKNSVWEWDGIFRGGLLDWGLTAPAVLLWGLFLWRAKADRGLLAGFTAMILLATAWFSYNTRFYGWYWFPIIALIPLLTCEVRASVQRSLVALAVATLVVNAVFARPIVAAQGSLKERQIAAVNDGPRIHEFVNQAIDESNFRIELVAWYVEPGVALAATAEPILSAGRPIGNLVERQGYGWIHEQRCWLMRPGDTACVVASHKLIQNPAMRKMLGDLTASPEFDVDVARGPYVNAYLFRRLNPPREKI